MIIRFLQNNGAAFKLIDADMIKESHEAAAALGVQQDASGEFSLAGTPSTSSASSPPPPPPPPPLGEIVEEGQDDGGGGGGEKSGR